MKFKATKFREGYDQDEVDDFLDLVRERLTQPEPVDVPVWQPGAPVISRRHADRPRPPWSCGCRWPTPPDRRVLPTS